MYDESIPIYIFISDSNEMTLEGKEKYKMIGSSVCFIENAYRDFDPFEEKSIACYLSSLNLKFLQSFLLFQKKNSHDVLPLKFSIKLNRIFDKEPITMYSTFTFQKQQQTSLSRPILISLLDEKGSRPGEGPSKCFRRVSRTNPH